MDPFLGFIILLIIISVVERLIKGQKKRRPPSSRLPDEHHDELPTQARRTGRPPRSELEKLISEALGINLERYPEVQPPAESGSAADRQSPVATAAESGPPDRQRPASREPGAPSSRVVYPTPADAEGRGKRAQQGKARSARPRRALIRRERGRQAPKARSPEEPISLEERGMVERGEALSLERPRTAVDHDDFHRRYQVPTPVADHEDFHRRYMGPRRPKPASRSGPRLPDNPRWSPALKAIVWSEILGSPKGFTE